MTSNATSQWLLQAVANKYHNPEVVRANVEAALSTFNGLRPKMDQHTQDTGESLLLLAVHGTLPVAFKGVVYNIPVAVWLPLTYPRHPPIAFVTPTANMLVRSGRHVDLAGRVYHPMLANWHNMPPSEVSLSNFLAAMQSVFAVEPPVYAKPAVPSQQATPPPIPLNPLVQRQGTASPQPGGYSQSPPTIPQKSFSAAPAIPPKTHAFSGISPNPPPPTTTSPPPPLVPNPLLQQQPQQNRGSGAGYGQFGQAGPTPPPKTLNSSNQSLSRPINIPQQSQYQYAQPVPISSSSGATFLSSSPSGSSPSFRHSQQFNHPAQQEQYIPPHQQLHQQPYQLPQYPRSQQTQQYYQASPPTVSTLANQQPVVQPPQNLITPTSATSSPTKLTQQQAKEQKEKQERERRARELREILAGRLVAAAQDVEVSSLREFERMRALGVGLVDGEGRAREVVARLNEEEAKVRRNIEILGAKVGEMQAVIDKVKREPEVQVDEILTSTTVVHNQLLELIAEEHALDDLIYQLGKALNAEKVEPAVFMKHTRILARELFLKRALIKKIQLHIQLQ